MKNILIIQTLCFVLAFFFSNARAQNATATYMDRVIEDTKIVLKPEKAKPYKKNIYDPSVHYDYAQLRTKKISAVKLGTCLAKISDQYEHKLTFQPSHSFCLSLITGKNIKNDSSQKLPTFLQYLVAQVDRTCDFASGKEDQLKDWVMSQPDNSIDLVKIYDISLRFNQGDIFNAVLTIYQLLRNNARWWDVNRYQYDSDSDRQKNFFNKFMDIRGDLKERGEGFHGDHSGSWYRIWGAILFQLERFDENTFQTKIAERGSRFDECHALSLSQDFKIRVGSTLADGASVGDEWLKWKGGLEEDMGKINIDLAASEAAGEMIWSLLHRPCSFALERAESLSCAPESYIYSR